ncbi:hypothetical protein HJG60_011508 [Phyllostomus discolor]|uniref:RRM domain-containing protein n=1 Tax=Phyllostomus discolor TaxID=89673 RepID=A0A834E170_9CHIR|nr:hypothetical protein HJG60_011508 [Phyllostomus discolor]
MGAATGSGTHSVPQLPAGEERAEMLTLPPDITEEEMSKLFEKYGKADEAFIHKDKNFGFIHLETRTPVEIAKVELDNMPLHGKQLPVHFACHSAFLIVRNLCYVSNKLLEEAFSVFGQVERDVVIVDIRGRPSGKGIVEFSGKPTVQKALDRYSEGFPAKYISSACDCGAHEPVR